MSNDTGLPKDWDRLPKSNGEGLPKGPLCGKCFSEEAELFDSPCREKPELLRGTLMGMYHCPDCGTMLVAGFPHPKVCARCKEELTSAND